MTLDKSLCCWWKLGSSRGPQGKQSKDPCTGDYREARWFIPVAGGPWAPSVCPTMENQGQKWTPCPEILCHIKVQSSPASGQGGLRFQLQSMAVLGVQAPSQTPWALWVVGPHGCGKKTCDSAKQVQVTSESKQVS